MIPPCGCRVGTNSASSDVCEVFIDCEKSSHIILYCALHAQATQHAQDDWHQADYADGVRAERERCANIAANETQNSNHTRGIGGEMAYELACREIAAAIRQLETTR